MIGEPDAGKPPVRFDEGVQETCGIVTRLCPTLHISPLGNFFGGISYNLEAGATPWSACISSSETASTTSQELASR